MSGPDVLKRALDRERRARKQAEQILEDKSRELFLVNEQLRATAEELQTQVVRNDVLVNEALDGIITIWSDNTVELFNPEAERLFGYSFEDVRGKSVNDLKLTADAERRRLDFEAYATDTRGDRVREYLGQHRDGSSFWMEVTARRVSLGPRDAITLIVRDVSERRELEKQLRHGQKMESIGQLAAGVAHEINTPIQYVGDNTRFLKDSFDDLLKLLAEWENLRLAISSEQLTSLSTQLGLIAAVEKEADIEFLKDEIPSAIEQSLEGSKRVARIVAAMKNFSHPGTKGKKPTDINAAIESTVMVSRNEWKYVANMELDLSENLPQIDCHVDSFNQVILNLVVNAAHAIGDCESDAGGQIRIATKTVGDEVEVTVTDNGNGIPEAAQGKIFDPFFTTKSLGTGTGQGLALSYAVIVEQHDGRIDFKTVEGEGTTFFIRLPIRSASANSEEVCDETPTAVC